MSTRIVPVEKASKVIDLIKKTDANKRAAAAAGGGAAVGAIAGYLKGKKDGKKKGHKKKASETNKYLEKIAASIGAVGKALIRTKLAPAMANMSKSTASRVEGIARASAGSKVVPKVYSTAEYAQHATAMSNIGKKLMPGGVPTSQTNKIMAVAARARRMGVIPGK